MLSDFSLISHGVAAVIFALLTLLVAVRYMRRDVDQSLALAALVSAVWAAALFSHTLWDIPGFHIRYMLELLRDASWITLLLAMLRATSRQGIVQADVKRIIATTTLFLVIFLLGFSSLELMYEWIPLSGKVKVLGQIALALLGLSLIEQIWRNAPGLGRSSIKYLCIGVGTIFAFDFFMYADALLFGHVSDSFWSARGVVNALMVPLLAINVINTRKQPIDFQLSRSAAFHAGTLVFAGVYLILLAIGGYWVRVLGGDWGEALRVLFIAVALSFLLVLLLSRRLRARLMVLISQHFFDYKYDYREEWLKMTRELANISDTPPLPVRVIRILSGLVQSNAGAVWVRDEQGDYRLRAAVNLSMPARYTTIDANADLVHFFQEREWIVDLKEYRADPVTYNLLEIPDPIIRTPEAWLIIPMYLGNDLYGITLIGAPYARVELNWENYDLIKVVARQACNLLAQADAQHRLSRAMQFEAVNKASAFMVHDLKTVIAQLLLLVRNAHKHRDNPAFIDDMINTTEHAVRKMSNLVDHIRKPVAVEEAAPEDVDLAALVTELCKAYSHRAPAPRLVGKPPAATVRAHPEQLRNILGHLIANAQDATPPDGDITLNLKIARGNVVLFIQDTGTGMSEEFIRTSLFKPFESTKGLTGMGIGAYQAREYIRKLGGSIDVTSETGVGSCFSVRIPLTQAIDAGVDHTVSGTQDYDQGKAGAVKKMAP